MSRKPVSGWARHSGTFGAFVVAVCLASCGSSSSTSGGAGSMGAYAAGIGGAGQTNAAGFLIGVQFVGANPAPTVVSSNGTLTEAQSTPNSQTVMNASALTGAIDPSGTIFYEAASPGLWAFTINRQNGNLTEMSASPYDTSMSFDAVAVDELGKFVYAYGDSGEVYGYSLQAGTGQLSPITVRRSVLGRFVCRPERSHCRLAK